MAARAKEAAWAIRLNRHFVEVRMAPEKPKAMVSQVKWKRFVLRQVWWNGGKVLGTVPYEQLRKVYADTNDEPFVVAAGTARKLTGNFLTKLANRQWRQRVGIR